MTTVSHEPPRARGMSGGATSTRFSTPAPGSRTSNAPGAEGWRVVGVTTKKQLFIAPPQAIILMRELEPTG